MVFKKFCLTNDFDVSFGNGTNSKVCVVGMFGKSRLSPFTSKATCLNSVIDRDVFQGDEGYLQEQIDQGNIECFYDGDSQVMYLHLLSFNDINQLGRECQQLAQSSSLKDFYSIWQSEHFVQIKNLAFLFATVHILLLYHPGNCFDLSYLRLFQNLDNIRLKLQPHMSDLLSSVSGVSKDWASFGRLCTPRMLFVFETPTIDVQPDDSEGGPNKSNKKYSPMKKLQMAIEDTIFRILRKTRAITDISNNSLFSVPLNQPYVFIQARRSEISDPIDFLLSQIRSKCFPAKEESSHSGISAMSQGGPTRPKPYSASRRARPNPPVPESLPLSSPSWKSSVLRNNAQPLSSLSMSSVKQQTSFSPTLSTSSTSLSTSYSSTSAPRGQELCLKEFLWQHIEMVFAKSVNDNMGRHRIEPVLELPNLDTWLRSAHCLYNFLFPLEGQELTQPLSSLKNSLDISMKFSESRCQKWMSTAENTYQQALPPFYVTTEHQNRLAKAKRVFSQYARGPAFNKYLCELEMWCDAYWKAGRQQCESVSLSGNLCTLQRHHLPNRLKDKANDDIPEAKHCSGLKTRSACNCGRKQAEKEDPFSHKYANHTFYDHMEATCCGNLEHITLPVFVTSTSDPSPVSHTSPQSDPSHRHQRQDQHPSQSHDGADSQKTDAFSTLSDMSWALSLDQQSNAATIDPPAKLSQSLHSPGGEKSCQSSKDGVDSLVEDDAVVMKKEEDCILEEKSLAERQISTTEYLTSMIHTKSPSGLLPKFSSFSLCRLGPASFYPHVIGLDMPGFLPGSSFLLPWDILIKHESREKWPSVTETFGPKKRQQRKLSKVTLDSAEIQTTVRVYLGMEYECPRGHRFFCSGPDKIIKVSANSSVKDNAGRLVQMDMPLYTLCHCKQPKGCMAQMMRVFIVTPRDSPNCPSVRVQANPIIQPSPPPCPQFHPGLDSALELPSDGVWVLRLPHIYQDDECVYLMPSDPHSLHSCYLIKGTFSYRIV